MKRPPWWSLVCLLPATGCAQSLRGPDVQEGEAAYAVVPPPSAEIAPQDYVIGPLDTLDVTVFDEPEVSAKGLSVDAAGNLALPLIGPVRAAGQTASSLSELLRDRYARYYVRPQVTVTVTGSVSQRVTVQGQVREPGLYDLRGDTTLLDAVALAKGETENAALREILVIRMVEGRRTAALFDLNRIRRGEDADPAIQGKDVIVVGHSNVKQVWHDTLRAAPLLNVFTQF